MKKIFIIATYSAVLLSCGQTRSNQPDKPEKPKALEDKSSMRSDVFKRLRASDLIDDLYGGILDSSEHYKKLETALADFETSSPKALDSFNTFDSNNRDYFKAADDRLSLIKDSTLRNEISAIIKTELANYEASVQTITQRKKTLISKTVPMADLRNSLKILLTLKVMTKYQRTAIPEKGPIDNEIKKADSLINTLQAEIQKSK